ncbi:MAG: HAMP domain-containing histidine kinase [Ktedonobacteraceae bacterium]|nr:HAMP domain-containing histidine kinase [Ktedonobacteraceae bacterium]
MRFQRVLAGKLRIPLRLRLALWSAGLVFFLSIALLLFVNIQTIAAFPTVMKKQLAACSQNSKCGSQTFIIVNTSQQNSTVSRQEAEFGPILTPLTYALRTELGTISLIGLGLVALLGGAGAYLLSGFALRPLRQMSETTRHIHSNTLHTRLARQGPRDEVRTLADTFDAMLERLEQSFDAQKRFVAAVSHELRTPLASLRANLEIVATDEETTMNDYRLMIATQERAISRLERLVADLLLLTASEQPATLEQVALSPLAEEVMDDLQSMARERQVALSLDCQTDPVVMGDSLLLARVFSNLIENAICYNCPGGRAVITLTQCHQQAVVSVVDTGIGIAADQQEVIFERFYRVDHSRSRHRGGAGLGLSLVSSIVRQHGGQVQVKSAPGHGSTFTVCLPLTQEKLLTTGSP